MEVQFSFCCQGLLISLKTKRCKLLAYGYMYLHNVQNCEISREIKILYSDSCVQSYRKSNEQ